MFKLIWKIIIGILAIGLPVVIYLGFFAKEPVLDPEYDVLLGRQTVAGIGQDAEEYPILSRDSFPEVYSYLQNMVNELVESPSIQFKGMFKYDSLQIINRDDILNAFCSPGGYIYVYTGLIKYLDAKEHLAGVLGHEIAHAEMRHSSLQLQREFGRKKILEFSVLAAAVSIKDAISVQILGNLMNLDYSREHEAEADKWSVTYLQDAGLACNGAAGFFEKLLAEDNDIAIPEFLSDHPDSKARVRDINSEAKNLACSIELSNKADWKIFQALLPSNSEILDSTKIGEDPNLQGSKS